MTKILVIPDVHGRRFWKKPCKELVDKVDEIVFLGDYVDPYPYDFDPYKIVERNGSSTTGEYIDNDDVLPNLADIINFADLHKDKVTLLLGNHDMHYISSVFYQLAGGTRYNRSLAPQIKELFNEDRDLFYFAHLIKWKGGYVLFTHAGVNKGWFEMHSNYGKIKHKDDMLVFKGDKFDPETLASDINSIKEGDDNLPCLCEIGWSRGGGNKYGSSLWSDCEEYIVNRRTAFVPDEFKENGIFQVFGHTRLRGEPIVMENAFACLDCSKAFIWEDGIVKNLDGKPLDFLWQLYEKKGKNNKQ